MKLLIVIVNYRTADLTIDCLRSLDEELKDLDGVRVVVTDNQSGDDSPDRIKEAIKQNNWGGWAELMPLARNGGFAYGNNEAIRAALESENPPEYVLLLNPDTIVRPEGIKALLGFMDEHKDVGIAGSRLEYPDGTAQHSAFRFHSIRSELDNGMRLGIVSKMLQQQCVAPPIQNEPHQTDWVSGASLIIRREVFDDVGLMDEGYFMYYEEADFCLQAHRAGWPCWYVPQSRIVHLIGQASGVQQATVKNKRRPSYWFDSRRRYFVKNHGLLYAALIDAAWLIGLASYRLRRLIQRKQDMDPLHILPDSLRNSVFVRGGRI